VSGREWTLPLAFTKPLSLNDRQHWQTKRKLTRAWRDHTRDLAVRAGIPHLARFTVVLHYVPRDNRRRDVDNVTPSLKAAVDGLVDAHVADDDDSTRYRLTSPEIHPARKGEPGRMWLVVRDLSDEPGVQAALDLTTEGSANP
jgi:crossover junction endodeoxyribonuclease RusA